MLWVLCLRFAQRGQIPSTAGQQQLPRILESFERRSPDDIDINFLKRGRGKKAICLDLKQAEGVELFMRLVEQAHVVVENFSVGITARLGVGYEAVRARNRRIVYCALTGYGSTGPDAGVRAYDVSVQAAAGLMSVTGLPGQPPMKARTHNHEVLENLLGLDANELARLEDDGII
jgi:crotonobetainyl-CoA:carnitine CoA-transferase CaiB-like acyl-CoA transferase